MTWLIVAVVAYLVVLALGLSLARASAFADRQAEEWNDVRQWDREYHWWEYEADK